MSYTGPFDSPFDHDHKKYFDALVKAEALKCFNRDSPAMLQWDLAWRTSIQAVERTWYVREDVSIAVTATDETWVVHAITLLSTKANTVKTKGNVTIIQEGYVWELYASRPRVTGQPPESMEIVRELKQIVEHAVDECRKSNSGPLRAFYKDEP